MAPGTAQFVGKIYYPELKELPGDNCYLKFNVGMSIYDRNKKSSSMEFVSLIVFGELARATNSAIIEDGHDFCMAFADVRCRQFVTKNGHKNRIPSFECRQLITRKAPKREQHDSADYGHADSSKPF